MADAPADLPSVLTLDELAEFLRISKTHVSRLSRGKIRGVPPLPVMRLGRRILIRREALLHWLRHQGSE